MTSQSRTIVGSTSDRGSFNCLANKSIALSTFGSNVRPDVFLSRKGGVAQENLQISSGEVRKMRSGVLY